MLFIVYYSATVLAIQLSAVCKCLNIIPVLSTTTCRYSIANAYTRALLCCEMLTYLCIAVVTFNVIQCRLIINSFARHKFM